MTFSTTVPTITASGAQALLAVAEREARRIGLAATIAITDGSGDLVAFLRMDGAPLVGATLAPRKAQTAARLKMPSSLIAELVRQGHDGLVSIPEIVAVGGGVPLFEGGALIGAIGVSGGSAEQDEQIGDAAAAHADGRGDQPSIAS